MQMCWSLTYQNYLYSLENYESRYVFSFVSYSLKGNIKFTRPSGLREYDGDHAVFALSALLGFFVGLLHVREWTAKRENVLGVSCALS